MARRYKRNWRKCENLTCDSEVFHKAWVKRFNAFGFGACKKHLIELFGEKQVQLIIKDQKDRYEDTIFSD